MKKQVSGIFILIAMMFCICSSCTEEVDFDQINDAEISPVVESSLFYFNGTAGNFFFGGSEVSVDGDFIELDIFNNQFMNDNLVKAELEFEVVNSINRSYEIRIDFLDEFDSLTHSFNFSTNASPLNEDITKQHIEVFEGDDLLALKATRKMEFTLVMLPGEVITPSSLGNISLKSKGIFYFNIEA